MTVSAQQRALLRRLAATKQALVTKTAKEWLAVSYKKYLHGGWEHPELGFVTKPHTMAIEFHEACKLPQYRVFLIAGGNRSGKTFTGLSEFCSWIIGTRPWDGSPTAPLGSGRRWLLAGQSFSHAFPSTLNPYFEQRMGDQIVDIVKDHQKNTIRYYLKNGDIVHCLSYQQWDKASKQAGNPFEGSAWYGAYFDEPPPYDVWIAVQRGLVTGASQGWGKSIIAATIIEHPWLLHELYAEADNLGGKKHDVFAIHFTIYDNPFNTPESIERFAADMSDELRQVRLYGRPRFLSGRVFPEFDEEVHVYDEQQWNPLGEEWTGEDGQTSTPPIIMAIDPHHAKVWAITWIAVLPKNDRYVVAEWPEEPYHKLKAGDLGYDDYANIIREVEARWSGGSQRVLWREFDPNLSRTPSTALAGSSMAKEMRARGFYFRTDANDKIVHGHEIIHTHLQCDWKSPLTEVNRPHLFVNSKCTNTIWSFHNYAWEPYREGDRGIKAVPKPMGKDHIDTIRYALSRDPTFQNWQDAIMSPQYYSSALEDLESW